MNLEAFLMPSNIQGENFNLQYIALAGLYEKHVRNIVPNYQTCKKSHFKHACVAA